MKLARRVQFLESVIRGQGPHQAHGHACKLAEAHGVRCCNPACNGQWGTGCWCCHHLEYALSAAPAAIDGHLMLRAGHERDT